MIKKIIWKRGLTLEDRAQHTYYGYVNSYKLFKIFFNDTKQLTTDKRKSESLPIGWILQSTVIVYNQTGILKLNKAKRIARKILIKYIMSFYTGRKV